MDELTHFIYTILSEPNLQTTSLSLQILNIMILKLQSSFWPYISELVPILIIKLNIKFQIVKDNISIIFRSMFKCYDNSSLLKYLLVNTQVTSIPCKIESFKIIEPAINDLCSIKHEDLKEIVLYF